LQSDWQRHAVGERLDGGLKATVGQDGWMDAASELAELSDGGAHPFDAFGDDGGTFTVSLRELQCHHGFHQPLLRSVVKVAYDLAALLVGGLHDPRSRCK
jgi:hypothetical protein